MRPLTEDESKAVFTKLANYIVQYPFLIQDLRTADGRCFVRRERISYISLTGQMSHIASGSTEIVFSMSPSPRCA